MAVDNLSVKREIESRGNAAAYVATNCLYKITGGYAALMISVENTDKNTNIEEK
ncbi:hypothetical protein H206_03573 [Candidatus Electrothrix aarhusensis]|jgi:hypothetical protein|uniref:Uncharacterized protein n=1 Tax=Candidatus Electrothrix aarhusensis TaxID=1859131 RepID=A0A3S3SNU1_9BACT|nr:hypothetical protein H206_03573 [Candidatus Electrothrix aarhusensis]